MVKVFFTHYVYIEVGDEKKKNGKWFEGSGA